MTDARGPILAAFYGTHGYTEADHARAVQALALMDAADREQGVTRFPSMEPVGTYTYAQQGDF